MNYPEFLKEWRDHSPFFLAQTSGSTGTPKTIEIRKEFAFASARRTNGYFNIKENSHLHSCISPDFIGGKMMAVRAEISGARLSWEEPSNRPLKNLRRDEIIDLVSVVPSQMLFILDNLNSIPMVKAFLIGGAPLQSSLRKKIVEKGVNAFESYGMTETSSHIALRKVTIEPKPFKSFDDIFVDTDDRGCLNIHFDSGEKFFTNDIAEIISPHEFFIKGRADNIIITGGKKVNPLEVEEKISEFIKIPFVITAVPDEKWGLRIILLLEDKEKTIDTMSLATKLKSLLSPHEFPKEIRVAEALKRTENGKLKRSGYDYDNFNT